MRWIRRALRTRLCVEHLTVWSYACSDCQERRYR